MKKQVKFKTDVLNELEALKNEYNHLKILHDKEHYERTLLEASLLESNSKLRLALVGGNIAWWEMDVSTGKITFDKRKVEMLDYPPENFRHYTDFTSLVHPDDYKKIMLAMSEHFNGTKDKYEAEYRIRAKSGEYLWFYDFGSVIKRDANGKPLICTGFVFNITGRKQSEETLVKSENMLQAVLDHFPGVVFWKDRQSTYLGCNQSFASGVGLKSPAEIIGETDFDLPWSHVEAEQYRADDINVMESGDQKLHIIETLHQTNGKVVWLDTNKIPLRDAQGQVIGVIGVSNDISILKTAEQELILANKELLFQIEEKEKRSLELIVAKEKTEESDQLKTAFLNIISHEIRTPFNGILGLLPILQDYDLTISDRDKFIGIINQNAVRLMNSIDEIVEISLIQAEEIEFVSAETNIDTLIEELRAQFLVYSKSKKLDFFIINKLAKHQTKLSTDTPKLKTILSNLIGNAFKFTKCGSVELVISKKSKYLEFSVKDTGVGIPKNKLEIIFDKFMQTNVSASREFEGLGLGLTIAKSYVKMLGGKIWVESEEGKGSTFYFTINHKA